MKTRIKEINKTVIMGVALLVIMILFAGCSKAESQESASAAIIPLQNYEYSANDLNDNWEESNLTASVKLDDNNTQITGSGVEYKNETLTINTEGTFLISGKLTNGQIVVAAEDTSDVHIILNGINITNKTAPVFYEKSADKVVITLAEGSKNTVTDGTDYSDTGSSSPDAAVYATHDLSINGQGELVVTGNYKNGIGSQDDLAIVSGTVTVNAKNNAIKGRDVLAIKDANITVVSEKDGLKSNNDTDKTKGYIQLDGGKINVTVINDGIQAETNIIVNGGDITIKTTGTNKDGTQSMKGLKAVSQISVKNGTLNIEGTDDAVHSNGNITVDGGTFSIKTEDDGFHADYATTINKGTINISECYEGIEGATVEINGGNMNIVSSDDAINAAGGSTDETTDKSTTDNAVDKKSENTSDGANESPQSNRGQGPGGDDKFGGSESDNQNNHIKVTGGTVNILAGSDGLDSNGALYIEGGNTTISTPSSGVEGTIDANGEILITGGTLTASGVTEMAQSPSADSTQNTVMIVSSTTITKGTTIYLVDSSGKIVAEHTPQNDCQLIMMSSPDIKTGEVYSVCSGSQDDKLFDLTISKVNTIVDSAGQETQLNGMGGGNQPPGNGERPSGEKPSGEKPTDGGIKPPNNNPVDS